MIRVLVVLPLYGGSLPVGRHCVAALAEAGCLVEVFEAPAFYSAFEALKDLKVRRERLDYLSNSFLQLLGQAVLAKADVFEPDLVFCPAQAPLSRQTLKILRQNGVATAMWFVEDFRLFTYWRAFAPYYDVFAVIQKEPFIQELQSLGVANVLYLPLAARPSVHRELELPLPEKSRYGSDLSFMGAGYPNRQRAFKDLSGYNFKIWGTEWDNAPDLARLVQMGGARISPEDTVKIFNASKINLNLHSSVNPEEAVSRGDFVNPRTFEVAACGAFQLVDERGLLPELFAADEMATFSSLPELKEKIDYYLKNETERKTLAQKAKARVLAGHTYKHRMLALLDFCRASLPGWPKERASSSWPEDLSPELKQNLRQLLEELGLTPNADFNTLITALRTRSGRLSPLESSLLFLDEWKKQYLKE